MGTSDRFAAFILSYKRPSRVTTLRTLRRQGYTGDVYIILSDDDDTYDQYCAAFGAERVIVFSKDRVAEKMDLADNTGEQRSVVFARNACFDIAERLGLDYFLELDDDYTGFYHKFDTKLQYRERPVKDLDRLFAAVLDFYKSIPALTVALAQNGDFVGGKDSSAAQQVWLKRKAMNSFFCSPKRRFTFLGVINEDVNTYVLLGHRGGLFFSVMQASLGQKVTQHNAGGMTDLYLDTGTYRKSFYPVMYAPSCVTIRDMGYYARIHHRINWTACVPCIVPEYLRKASPGGGGGV